MHLIDRATAIHFHRHRIAEFGPASVRALGWVDERSQQRRFEAIAAATDFNGCSVIDCGCGTGDLKTFLDHRFNGLSYLGIEQVPEFVAEARTRHDGRPRTHFECGDFTRLMLPRADHVIACGSLNYRSASPQHIFRAIARMFLSAAQSVVFTLIDDDRFDNHPLLIARDIEEITDFCQHLSPHVRVHRGHADGDALIVMHTHE